MRWAPSAPRVIGAGLLALLILLGALGGMATEGIIGENLL